MYKLITAFALVITGAGCRDTTPERDRNVAPKPSDEPRAPMPTREDTGRQAALPPECDDYKAAIERIRTCENLAQDTRDALKQAYDRASASWATITPENRSSVAASCKAARESIQQSVAACP